MAKKHSAIKHEHRKHVHPVVYEAGKIPTEDRTLGQRASDSLTSKMGSWIFILGFVAFLIAWVLINVYMWVNSWDPYPFILLNLVLSCLAALQAPIILMSQNRSAQKDRVNQSYDYTVDRHSLRQINKVLKEVTYLRSDMAELMKKYKRAKSATKK
tara:strand:+ start:111 stop:578 length:468 start_codon:yes stop_codon:yes gene_type:complete